VLQDLALTHQRPGHKDVLLAVMGVTGAGKSTFISLLTKENVQIGHGLESGMKRWSN